MPRSQIKTETKLWQILKKNTEHFVHWTRIESRSSFGVPDLNGCLDGREFWIELKIITTKTDNSYPRWSPLQIAWQTKRTRIGGLVWNLASHPSSGSLYLLDGRNLAERLMDGQIKYDHKESLPTTDDGWRALLDRVK